MKSVALHNLGCKVNGYEMDYMQQILQENGYLIVPFDTKADIYIINTCTVTNIADRKSRQMLHRAKKENPNAVVVAVGCYVQTGKEDIEKDPCIDLAVGNNKKKDIVQILDHYFAVQEQKKADKTLGNTTIIDINHTDEYETMEIYQTAEHSRAYVKIQDGCNQFCSYCAIPYARGRVRSRLQEDVLREIEQLVKNGYKEVVLAGIHVSSYGIDRGESELLALLQKINQIDGLERIRLSSLEPRIVTEEFAREIAALEKLCPHFHLSLQSGADATLQRMNRHYSAAEYKKSVEYLRTYFDRPAITTDVIVGFPGETDADFEECRRFLEDIEFYEMHIFKYSRRKGTRADRMPDQVKDADKSARSAVLLELEKKQSIHFREGVLGSEQEVLFEESKKIAGQDYLIGHTREYVRVACKADESLINTIQKVSVTGFVKDDTVLATLC